MMKSRMILMIWIQDTYQIIDILSNEQIEDEYDNDESRKNWNIDELQLKRIKIEELMLNIYYY